MPHSPLTIHLLPENGSPTGDFTAGAGFVDLRLPPRSNLCRLIAIDPDLHTGVKIKMRNREVGRDTSPKHRRPLNSEARTFLKNHFSAFVIECPLQAFKRDGHYEELGIPILLENEDDSHAQAHSGSMR